MRLSLSRRLRPSYDKEAAKYWQDLADLDDSLAIIELKTMQYPRSPSVKKAWENVGKHLYYALEQVGEERD